MESRLLSFEETAMLNSIHTSAAPVAPPMLVGGPFAYKKPQTKDSPVTAVQDLLRRVFSSLSDSQINDKAATDNLKVSEGYWSFLDNCEGLRPIEYMVQPRWTNMSKKQRTKRPSKDP
ncbi:hypothetical protein G6F56_008097 [Rhizopus delemar]|nr:hypothetical protein G6F56_008097 [Rhizopus delemar]